MNPALKNLCEQIDATVFTGDALEVGETLREFKEYVDRWQRDLYQRIAYRAGYIDGRERRLPSAFEHPSECHESYRRGHAKGLDTPMLFDKNGRRSIFDDVDL